MIPVFIPSMHWHLLCEAVHDMPVVNFKLTESSALWINMSCLSMQMEENFKLNPALLEHSHVSNLCIDPQSGLQVVTY